jgi:hypothetical protein
MWRVILEYLVPLVLPAAVYFAIKWWAAWRAAEGRPVEKPSWWDAPWPWLVGAGIVLMVATLAVLAITEGAPPGAQYRPAEMTPGGEVSPGGFVP